MCLRLQIVYGSLARYTKYFTTSTSYMPILLIVYHMRGLRGSFGTVLPLSRGMSVNAHSSEDTVFQNSEADLMCSLVIIDPFDALFQASWILQTFVSSFWFICLTFWCTDLLKEHEILMLLPIIMET